MNSIIQKFIQNVDAKRMMLIGIILLLIIQLTVSAHLLVGTLKHDKIYKGIYVNNIYVSGLKKEEAAKIIREKYQEKLQKATIKMSLGTQQDVAIETKNIVTDIDVDGTVSNAYKEGRKGNVVERLYSISNISLDPKTIPLEITYNEAKIKQLIGSLSNQLYRPMKQSSYEILEDRIKINLGQKGQRLDQEEFRNQLISNAQALEANEMFVPLIYDEPKKISIEDIYKEVFATAKNATYKVNGYKFEIIPEVIGRDFDVEYAKNTLEFSREKGSFEIPLKITKPKISEQQIQAKFMREELSSFTTKFNRGEVDRSKNVSLAASKINGIVIGPGQVFSYNAVVGERSAETGFKKAHVYIKGKIVDGIGGGICQVSTTLYNAVLFANLEVVERRNHNMLVSYVPPGRDATISYGSIDFRFRNNYSNPIQIKSSCNNGQLNIKILGTKEGQKKEIQLETVIHKSYYLPTKYIDDPLKPVGYTKTEQNPMRGVKASTYKIVKQNGVVVSKTKISTDSYNPLQKIVRRGTKKEQKQEEITPQTEKIEAQEVVIEHE